MRIFTKKAMQFDHPQGADVAPAVIVQPGIFETVPDWVTQATMFQWAQADGDIEVITNRQDEIAAEIGTKEKTKAEKAAEAKATAAAEKAAAAEAQAQAEADAKAKADADAAAAAQAAANQQ